MALMSLARWGGLAAVVGGALEVVTGLLAPSPGPPSLVSGDPAAYQIAILLGSLGSPLLAFGLVGLYARLLLSPGSRPAPTRILGTAGALLASLAMLAALFAVLRIVAVGYFVLDDPVPIGLLGLPLAAILLGAATLLSGVPRRVWGLLPLGLGVLMFSGLPLVLAGVGWVLFGLILWRDVAAGQKRPKAPGERRPDGTNPRMQANPESSKEASR